MGYYKLTFNVYADKIANIKKNYELLGEENPVWQELDGVTISDHKYDIFFWRDFVRVQNTLAKRRDFIMWPKKMVL